MNGSVDWYALEWRVAPGLPEHLVNSAGEVWKRLRGSDYPEGRRVSLMRDGKTHYRYAARLPQIAGFGRGVNAPEWLPLPDFDRYAVNADGEVIRRLAQKDNGHGYLAFHARVNGGDGHYYTHIIICGAFHGPAPRGGMQAAHRNGRSADNRPDNLRWATAAENSADKVLHGTDNRGVKNHAAKLSSAQVAQIRRRKAAGERTEKLAAEFHIHEETVRGIARGAKRRYDGWSEAA